VKGVGEGGYGIMFRRFPGGYRGFFVLFLFGASVSCVQGGQFLNVDPPVHELSLKPGERVKSKFQLSNKSSESVSVSVEVSEWWTQQTGLPGLEIEKWLKVKAVKPFFLKPDESRSFPFSVRLPKDWQGGETMAMVFFTTDPLPGQSGAVSFRFRHGVPIYVFSEGKGQANLVLESLGGRFLQGPLNSPIEFAAFLRNSGNIHVRPRGSLILLNGDQGNEGQVEEARFFWGTPTYPNGREPYFAKSSRESWLPGDYRAKVVFNYGIPGKESQVLEEAFSFQVEPDGDIHLKLEGQGS
jgi:hypothetical protein